MKVKMMVPMSGPLTTRRKGDELDIPSKEAARLFAVGYAEPIAEPEAAAMAPPVRRARSRKIEKAK